MLYDVGTHIDLRHMNTKMQIVEVPSKPAEKPGRFAYEKTQSAYDTGTQLIFKYVNDRMVTARKINVAFA